MASNYKFWAVLAICLLVVALLGIEVVLPYGFDMLIIFIGIFGLIVFGLVASIPFVDRHLGFDDFVNRLIKDIPKE